MWWATTSRTSAPAALPVAGAAAHLGPTVPSFGEPINAGHTVSTFASVGRTSLLDRAAFGEATRTEGSRRRLALRGEGCACFVCGDVWQALSSTRTRKDTHRTRRWRATRTGKEGGEGRRRARRGFAGGLAGYGHAPLSPLPLASPALSAFAPSSISRRTLCGYGASFSGVPGIVVALLFIPHPPPRLLASRLRLFPADSLVRFQSRSHASPQTHKEQAYPQTRAPPLFVHHARRAEGRAVGGGKRYIEMCGRWGEFLS
ncbi:hypothetical protein B0H13DRAFT_642318 [Mycena leptocephala]|nr:hypothetical protein B0H13DRAFT_642318 [Mycena leptocephala]